MCPWLGACEHCSIIEELSLDLELVFLLELILQVKLEWEFEVS